MRPGSGASLATTPVAAAIRPKHAALIDRTPTATAGTFPVVAEWQAVALLFVTALILRLLFLDRVPNSVTADELDFAGNALEVLAGRGPGLFGLDWTPEPALGVHFIAGAWFLFGSSLYAERLVAAVLTALAIFPFYALLRRKVGVGSALLTTGLFLSARWFLLFSRSGWNNGEAALYTLLAAWALTLALERRQHRYWIAFGAAAALLLYGYFAGRAVVLAFALYGVGLVLRHWRTRSGQDALSVLTGGAVAAVTCLLLFAPEIPTIVHHWQAFNRRTDAVSVFNQPLPAGETRLDQLAGKAWTATRAFLLMDPTVDNPAAPGASAQEGRYTAPGKSWLDPLVAALYIAGLVAGLRGPGLGLWWLLLLVPTALTQVLAVGTPDGARALPAVGPMFLFVGLAVDGTVRLMARTGRWRWPLLTTAAITVGAYNVASYARWVDSPPAVQARQPGIPAAEFDAWRDFQRARLRAGRGILPAGAYDQLSRAEILGTIQGQTPPGPGPSTAPPGALPIHPPARPPAASSPVQYPAHQIATIGHPGLGAGEFVAPRGLAVDAAGDLSVLDTARRMILRFGSSGSFLAEWAPGDSQPWAIAPAADGSLYVLDAGTGGVASYTADGELLTTVSLPARAPASRGLALGLDGNYYLAQTAADRLVRFGPTGAALLPAGPAPGNGYDQPTSAVGTLNGTLFIYEPDGGRLLLAAPDGRVLVTVQAPRANTVDAGRLAVLPDGRVLLADAPGHRVLVFAPDARLLGSFPVDGVPQGLAVLPDGSVAIADLSGGVIRLYAWTGES